MRMIIVLMMLISDSAVDDDGVTDYIDMMIFILLLYNAPTMLTFVFLVSINNTSNRGSSVKTFMSAPNYSFCSV